MPIESGWSSELSGGVGEGVVGADGGAPETRLERALTSTTLYVPPVADLRKLMPTALKMFQNHLLTGWG